MFYEIPVHPSANKSKRKESNKPLYYVRINRSGASAISEDLLNTFPGADSILFEEDIPEGRLRLKIGNGFNRKLTGGNFQIPSGRVRRFTPKFFPYVLVRTSYYFFVEQIDGYWEVVMVSKFKPIAN